MTDSKPLRAEYVGAVEAAPDVVVAVEVTETLHRPADDAAVHDDAIAWCGSTRDREMVAYDLDTAIAYGGRLCHACFRSALEYLARDAESDVSRREAPAPDADTSLPLATPDGGAPAQARPPLMSLTEVLAFSKHGKKLHAPVGEERTLCGREARGRVAREVAPRGKSPCKMCFDLEAVDDP